MNVENIAIEDYHECEIKNNCGIYLLIILLIIILAVMLFNEKTFLLYKGELFVNEDSSVTLYLEKDKKSLLDKKEIYINDKKYGFDIKNIIFINDIHPFYKVELFCNVDFIKNSYYEYEMMGEEIIFLKYIRDVMKEGE